MLKKLYKTFLISILCGSILMLDMSVKSGTLNINLSQAKAETLQTGAEGANKTSLMTTIEMLAIGLMASRLMLYGKITLDMGVAAAGGLAFIAGEVIAQQKLKKAAENIETEIKRKKDGKIDDRQLDMLVNLRQMYNDARDTAETKKTLQLAAAAAFVVAAGISYFYTAKDYTAFTTCLTTATTSISTGVPAGTATCTAASTVAAGACAPPAAICATALADLIAMLKAYSAARETPSPSCTNMAATNTAAATFLTSLAASPPSCSTYWQVASAPAASACSVVSPSYIASESGCIPAGLAMQVASFVPLLATMGISNGTGGMIAGGIVGAVMMFATSLAPVIDINILVPTRRAIIWGLMGAGAWMASSATDEQIKKLEGEIKKIDDLVNTINKQTNGVTIANSLHPKDTKNLNNAGLTVNAVESGETKIEGGSLPCITKPGASGKDCPSVSSSMLALPGFSSLPEGLQQDVRSISSMADGLNGSSTVKSGSLSSASNVAANAIAMKKRSDQLKKFAQDALSKANSNFDFDKEEKNTHDNLLKNVNNEFSKKNINLGSLMASFGNSGLNAVLSKEVSKDGKVTTKPFKMPEIAMPVIPTMNVPKMTDIKEEKKEEPKVEQAAATTATSIDDYEMTNDINTDKNTSIFDVISRRYEKSGYPRLFKRLNE